MGKEGWKDEKMKVGSVGDRKMGKMKSGMMKV